MSSGSIVEPIEKSSTLKRALVSLYGVTPQTKPIAERSKYYRLFRASYTQAVLIGLISFTQPGIWSAIAGLGAGGLQTVGTANTANSILFGIMFVLAPFYAVLTNKVGVKPVITIGTIGYAIWSAGLYQNSKDGTQWLIMFGAATCGISASAFWTAEATIAVLYPSEAQRGIFIGTWQVINKVGGLISGAITLALNKDGNKSGSVSLTTYIVLIALQCLGFPLSFLVSPPEKVIRPDGSKVKSNVTKESVVSRFRKLFLVLKKKEVVCLLPLMISVTWFGTWQSNYITNHFSIRVRALNSLLSALIPGVTDVLAGTLLDLKYKRSTKVRFSWITIVILLTAFFIYSFILQSQFDNNPESGIDWSGNERYYKAFVPFQIFKIPGELAFNWLYWVIGAYHFKSEEIPYISGWIRSFESLGQCLAFVVGTVNSNDMTNLAVSAAVFFASVPTVTYIAWKADDEPIKEFIATDTELEEDEEDIDDSTSKNNLKVEVNSV